MRIVVDEENNAEEFWEHVRYSSSVPHELIALSDTITVSDERAAEIEAWCAKAPGFSDGPTHAPTALIFVENDDQGE